MIPAEKIFLATIAEGAGALAARHGLRLELDTFCTAANMDAPDFAGYDAQARAFLAQAEGAVLHAPFAEMSPAAVDPQVRAVVRARMEQAWALARQYGISRMVVHAGYIPQVYFPEWFIEQSIAFWRKFLRGKPPEMALLLENVLEDDPEWIRAIIDGVGDARLGACLDIGHAFCQSKHSLEAWIDCLENRVAHVHLHDNHGKDDEHLPLGEGSIPVGAVLRRLAEKAPEATYTLEMRDAASSVACLLDGGAEGGDEALAMLHRYFGYEAFREGQREAVQAQLDGRDMLAIMPTGGGKSIGFQLPAMMTEGVALVISPLISLMCDQVTALNQAGIRAAYLNSTLTERQFDVALDNARRGVYKLIYVAPERLLTPRFWAYARQARIALVAVDEAHCISQWGQDFRPSYLDIPRFLNALARRPVVGAFTATATPQVQADIIRLLGLQNPLVVKTGFDRPNLYYEVQRPAKKKEALLALLTERYAGLSGIVYCATRREVEEVCALLQDNGYPATRYHAGLTDTERHRNQEDFSFDRRPIIVATNAFGMGIDKSNIRFVIHYNMPKDVESYYQEAGRAGRDGERAECVLLYSGKDVQTQRFLIDRSGEELGDPVLQQQMREKMKLRLQDMVRFSTGFGCLRAQILHYFGQSLVQRCGNCGNCHKQIEQEDVTDIAEAVLACIKRNGQRFGMGAILALLHGDDGKRMRDTGLAGDPMAGALANVPTARLKLIGEQLLAEGYLQEKPDARLPIIMLGDRAQGVLEQGERVLLYLPQAHKASRVRGGRKVDKVPMSAGESALFDALRTVRRRLADDLGVPAYVVFSDATLRDMAEKRPVTRAEMMQVKGVGEAKLARFGDVFLQEISGHGEA